MPLPPDFVHNSLYEREAWFVDDLELHPDEQRIVAICDTTRLGRLVDQQRPWPGHEKHVPGAVAIQITGTLGQLYAMYVLGMPATEGWIGYGTHVHDARFRHLGRIGPPMACEAKLISRRDIRGTIFTRFRFSYVQDDKECFRSEQTAAWVRTTHRGPCPA